MKPTALLILLAACGPASHPPAEKPGPTPAPSQAVPVLAARGVYASEEALCDRLAADHDVDSEVATCRRGDDGDWDVPASGVVTLASPAPPYHRVRLVATEALDVTCHLLFELDGGKLFLGPPLPCGSERSHADVDIAVEELSTGQVVPGGPPEVVLRLRTTTSVDESAFCEDDCENARVETSFRRDLVICGIGASGIPSCTEPLPADRTRADDLALDFP